MKWLGLDYGDKTIGIAISDELGWTAQGIETYRRRSEQEDLDYIGSLIGNHGITGIVVGFPRNMNGTIGPQAERCKAFADSLAAFTGLTVKLWDERLTTVAAERTLLEADVSRKKRKLVIDKLAAGLILQGFLDSNSTR